jgi:5,10-methylene-tetrahydrofolate dehydrogenase/methenyl tetrahydrofolate cyclohydrolase
VSSDGDDLLSGFLDWFGTIEGYIPGARTLVGEILLGKVPEASITQVYGLAHAWGELARQLSDAYADAEHAADDILNAWVGDGAPMNFADQWLRYLEALASTAESTSSMQEGVQGFGLEIELLKFMVLISLLMLAYALYALIAAAFATFGGTLAGIGPAFAVARTAIANFAAKAITAIGNLTLRTALKGLAEFLFRELPSLIRAGFTEGLPWVFREGLPNLGRSLLPRNVIARSVGDRVAGRWVSEMAGKELTQQLMRVAGEEGRVLLTRAIGSMRGALAHEVEEQLARRFGTTAVERGLASRAMSLAERELFEQITGRTLSEYAARQIVETTFRRELVRYLGMRMAFGAGLMGGGNLLGQMLQVAFGHRTELDPGQALLNAAQGAAFGAGMFGGIPGHIIGGGIAGGVVGTGMELMNYAQTGKFDVWNVARSAAQGADAGAIFGAQNHLNTMVGPRSLRIGQEVMALPNERGGVVLAALDRNSGMRMLIEGESGVAWEKVDIAGNRESAGWIDARGNVVFHEPAEPAPTRVVEGEFIDVTPSSHTGLAAIDVPSRPAEVGPRPQVMPAGGDGGGPRQPAAPPREPAAPPRELAAPPREPAAPPRELGAPPRESAAPPREPAAPPREPVATGRSPEAARVTEPVTPRMEPASAGTHAPAREAPLPDGPREPVVPHDRAAAHDPSAVHDPAASHERAMPSDIHPHDGSVDHQHPMATTGAEHGEPPTPRSIEHGTVRMEDHPDFPQLVHGLQDQGFSLVDTRGDPHVVIRQVIDQSGNVIAVEHELHARPGMRYLDLEHEMGHVEQALDRSRFPNGPPLTDVVMQNPDGSRVQVHNAPQAMKGWQDPIVEYHNRLQEYIRLAERGVDPAVLGEHARGVDQWRDEYWRKGLKRGYSGSQAAWAEEHFPDIAALEERVDHLRATPPPQPDIAPAVEPPPNEPPGGGPPLAKRPLPTSATEVPYELVPVEPTRVAHPVELPEDVATALDAHVTRLLAGPSSATPDLPPDQPYAATWNDAARILTVRYPDGLTVDVVLQVNSALPPGHPTVVRPPVSEVDGVWSQTQPAGVVLPAHLPAEVHARPEVVQQEITQAWRELHDQMRALPEPGAVAAVGRADSLATLEDPGPDVRVLGPEHVTFRDVRPAPLAEPAPLTPDSVRTMLADPKAPPRLLALVQEHLAVRAPDGSYLPKSADEIAATLADLERQATLAVAAGGPSAHTASPIPDTGFVPDARPPYLPDLTAPEFLRAADSLSITDFAGAVTGVRAEGSMVRVETAGGRTHMFMPVVAEGLQNLAETTPRAGTAADPHVVRVNSRVAPEQLGRVWTHEIAETMQQHAAPSRPRLEGHILRGGSGTADPHTSARLAERRYLIRELTGADSVAEQARLRRDVDGLDRDLHRLGYPTDRLEPVPAATHVPDRPARDALDNSTNDALWTDPPWREEGRRPSLDELIPSTAEEATRWEAAVRAEFAAQLDGFEFGGVRARMDMSDPHAVSVYRNEVTVRLDLTDTRTGATGRVVRTFHRDHDGTLFVEHNSLRVPDSAQGRGFAAEWNRNLEQWYRYSGVSHIEVHASSTVGGYAWARAGYGWAPHTEHRANAVFARLRAEMRQIDGDIELVRRWVAGDTTVDIGPLARRYGSADPAAMIAEAGHQREAGQQILDRAAAHRFGTVGYPTPYHVSQAGWSGQHGRDATWIGKRAMLGADWKGVKPISEEGPRFPRPPSARPHVTAAEVPDSQFHPFGRGAPEPELVQRAGEAALRGRLDTLPAAAPLRDVPVRLRVVDANDLVEPVHGVPTRAVARSVPVDASGHDLPAGTLPPEGGGYRVEISDRAADLVIERAVAHEVAELSAIQERAANGLELTPPDVLRPGPPGPGAHELSPHDVGRVAELDVLTRLLSDPAHAAYARSELAALREHLGLAADDPGAPARWELVEDRLGEQARSALDDWRWREDAVARTAAEFGLAHDPPAVRAIAEAYDVVHGHIAPFVVKVALDMLVDFRAQVAADPAHRILFIGRDGDALAAVVREVDPAFFDAHCSQITLSRRLGMLAVTDAEHRWGRTILPDGFRWRFDEPPSPQDVERAAGDLVDLLRELGVPVDVEHGAVTVVDSSFKGTVQEMLAALLPNIEFRGDYIWHGEAAADPHPGTKAGYVTHLGQPRLPTDVDPKWETIAYEYSMRGPLSSPVRFGPDGLPEQQWGREEPDALSGLKPQLVDPRYRDPVVRDAVMRVNQVAVADYARHVASIADPRGELEAGFTTYRRDVHAWHADARPGQGLPAPLERFLNSFVLDGPGVRARALLAEVPPLQPESLVVGAAERGPGNAISGGRILRDVHAAYDGYHDAIAATGKRATIIRFRADEQEPPEWRMRMEASRVSAEQKVRNLTRLGVGVDDVVLDARVSAEEFAAVIERANADPAQAAVIVQMPAPPRLRALVDLIEPAKDIDGLLGERSSVSAPATAEGIVRVAEPFLADRPTVAVVGARGFIGRGVVGLLERHGIDPIRLDIGDDLTRVRDADVVISVAGNPGILGPEHLQPHHRLVIDSSFVPQVDGTVLGDVRPDAVGIPQHITPVPGGIGPVEMAILVERTVRMLVAPDLPSWRYPGPAL